MHSTPSPTVLDEKDAARYIAMSTAFLRRARMVGRTKSGSTGPAYVRVPGGRAVRYRVTDLDAWLAANVHGGATEPIHTTAKARV